MSRQVPRARATRACSKSLPAPQLGQKGQFFSLSEQMLVLCLLKPSRFLSPKWAHPVIRICTLFPTFRSKSQDDEKKDKK